MKNLLFILLLLPLAGCEQFFFIEFDFNKQYDMYFYFSGLNKENDTAIVFPKEALIPIEMSRVIDKSTYSWGCTFSMGTIEKFYSNLGTDTLCLFLFDKNIVDSEPWNNIVDNYIILQRYDLTKEDIKRMNYKIYYPPVESMSDMHMYPPYKEVVSQYNN